MGKRHNRPVCNCKRFNLFRPGVRPTFLFYHNTRQNARIFCKGWGFCAYRLSVLYMAIYITLRLVLNWQSLSLTTSSWQLQRLPCNRLHRGASAALPPPIHQGESANFKLRTAPKPPLRRILQSSCARRKIGERYKLQITVPQNFCLQKSKSVTWIYGDRLSHYLG